MQLRRFTYTNWCPICEADSSRRRSKSETLEPFDNNAFRKRLRDTIKTPSPKKEPSSENTTYGVGDARNLLETSRLLRANLCELPTTYINNCQPQLSPEKLGYGADAVTKMNGITRLHYLSTNSQIENRASSEAIKFNEAFYHEAYKNLAPTKNFINRISSTNGSRMSTPRLEEFPPVPSKTPEKKPVVEGVREEPVKRLLPTPRPRKVEAYQLPIRPKTCTIEQMRSDNYNKFRPKDVTKHKSDPVVVNDNKQPMKSCYVIECQANQKNLPTPNDVPHEKTPVHVLSPQKSPKPVVKSPVKLPPTPEKPDKSIKPEKLEKQDKTEKLEKPDKPDKSDKPEKQEKPEKSKSLPAEITRKEEKPASPPSPKPKSAETSETKRHRVRPRSDSDNSAGVPDKPEQTKKAREVSPPQPPKKELKAKSAVKLASIKNRHKISVTKLRKVRNKIAHSVSSDSNLSGSDFEYTEDEDQHHDEPKIETSGSTPTHKINAGIFLLNVKKCGLFCLQFRLEVLPTTSYTNWPLRASLFAHVPPYVKFSSHDTPSSSKLPHTANKHLKWRLSNITPIVVRKTLSNTGFRLVRSEYSRGLHAYP